MGFADNCSKERGETEMNYKDYYERHKTFRASYCEKQINVMLIGNFVGALWLIFVYMCIITPDYITYAATRKVIYAEIVNTILLSIVFTILKLLPIEKFPHKPFWMEFFSFVTSSTTMVWCCALLYVMFPEGEISKVINPVLGWLTAWALYSVFVYYPIYLYILLLIVSIVPLCWVFGHTNIAEMPINIFLLATVLFIGSQWRYIAGRANYEITKENRRLIENDRLTNVYNRYSYDQHIAALRNQEDSQATVILFDVNGLKEANDHNGHIAGDELIQAAANCISATFGKRGKCFRVGGDEFIVVIDEVATDIDQLSNQFDAATRIWHGDYTDHLSVSYGIAQGNASGDGISELIKAADANMYKAKRQYYMEHAM